MNNSIIERKINIYIKYLYEALQLLPNYENEVYIGINNPFDRNLFLINNQISWSTFMSSSSLWKVAVESASEFTEKKRGTIFIIKSKTGKFIGQYSQYTYDAEVIFAPNTKFIVKNWYMGDVIALGQSNIRESTFKIKDIDKMINSNDSLIIELEQL